VPLSTLSEMRQTRSLEEVHQKSSALEGIVAQQEFIRHRPVDLPEDIAEGRFSFEVKGNLIPMTRQRQNQAEE
jgi:hypothetical protein